MNNAYVPCEQVTCAGEGWRGEKTTSAGIATIIHNPIKENVFIISILNSICFCHIYINFSQGVSFVLDTSLIINTLHVNV